MTAQEKTRESRARILEAQAKREKYKTELMAALARIANAPDATPEQVIAAAGLALELRK